MKIGYCGAANHGCSRLSAGFLQFLHFVSVRAKCGAGACARVGKSQDCIRRDSLVTSRRDITTLRDTWFGGGNGRVHTSVNAARMSARATLLFEGKDCQGCVSSSPRRNRHKLAPVFGPVRHRRRRGAAAQRESPEIRAVRSVHGVQRRIAAAHKNQSASGHDCARRALHAKLLRQLDIFQGRVVPYPWIVAERRLPYDLALVQIDRRKMPIGRLE